MKPMHLRLRELDSLRGFAALTVVLLHFYEMWSQTLAGPGTAVWKLKLLAVAHPFYSGHEAVILFFLMSGFLLARPYFKGGAKSFPVFAMRRILRIYFPYLAALGLSVLGAAVWHHGLRHGTWSSQTWSRPIERELVVQHVIFLGMYDWTQFDPAIWSLIYEMRISLVLPALVWLVRQGSDLAMLGLAVLSSAVVSMLLPSNHGLWSYGILMTVHYGAIYGAGIMLARSQDEIAEAYGRVSRPWRMVLLVAALLVYSESGRAGLWLARARLAGDPAMFTDWISVLGAAGLMVTAMHSARVKGWLNRPAFLYFGKISYSTYLVHLIALFAITYLVGDRIAVGWQLVLYLAGTYGLAGVFYRVVEAPCVWLSQHFGDGWGVAAEVRRAASPGEWRAAG